jgi:hypothetical protein
MCPYTIEYGKDVVLNGYHNYFSILIPGNIYNSRGFLRNMAEKKKEIHFKNEKETYYFTQTSIDSL